MDFQPYSKHMNSIHTREKIGTLCKRFIKNFYENRSKIHTFKDIVSSISAFSSDMKKILDLIFVLEGMGIITRISKNGFIFTGFKGMATKLNGSILKRGKKLLEGRQDHLFVRMIVKAKISVTCNFIEKKKFAEEIKIEEKKYSIRTNIYIGMLTEDIMSTLMLNSSKSISKNEIENLIEQYSARCKEITVKGYANDMINLLGSLGFVEKNEINESLTWIGPDCINTSGLTLEGLNYVMNLEDIIRKNNNVNLASREAVFFKALFREIDDKKEKKDASAKKMDEEYLIRTKEDENLLKRGREGRPKEAISSIKDEQGGGEEEEEEGLPPMFQISKFQEQGYAFLKSKNWKFILKRLQLIIGKLPPNKDILKKKGIKWTVDVDLPNAKKISRQHAVILYNFKSECFEIKCISKKYPIRVDGQYYTYKEGPVMLYSRSLVQIGTESFYFLLPYQQGNEEADKKKEEQGEQDEEEEEEEGEEEERRSDENNELKGEEEENNENEGDFEADGMEDGEVEGADNGEGENDIDLEDDPNELGSEI